MTGETRHDAEWSCRSVFQADGLEQAGPEHFVTPEQVKRLQRWKAKQSTSSLNSYSTPKEDPGIYYGTVGCVALTSKAILPPELAPVV